uniref:Phosphatidylinositol 3 kinase regulatory subunit n=1 Tax=Echinococcus granulosus TaxID=6210 RepID=A0A068WIX5_ECHGR|nr:phosphatidylinositol 3 kinase regulatory subunit [Echinococcus granulosus]
MKQGSEPVHNLVRVSVAYPRLCQVCEDYIITPRCTARQCITCGCLLHAVCIGRAARCQGSLSTPSASGSVSSGNSEVVVSDTDTSAAVTLSDQPLANWSVEQVLQWLVVVGFSRYAVLFLAYNINGEKLPGLLKPLSPLDDIKDAFARRVLKRAIMTLIGELPSPADRKFASSKDSSVTPHADLHLQNFTCELACCVCSLPLLGLTSQGYQCSTCGSVFHRICRIFTEEHPACPGRLLIETLASSQTSFDSPPPDLDLGQSGGKLPVAAPVIKHTYLTVPLDKQITDADEVPIFLSTATRIFEQLATYNAQETTKQRPSQQFLPSSTSFTSALPMINCVDVYRSSATGRELYDLECAYADRLPTDLEKMTSVSTLHRLVRLAQIIKHFLKLLPEPVIPAEMYQGTLDLAPGNNSSSASATSGDNSGLEEFLSSLPPRNLATLRHVMQHVGFILCHQRLLKVRLSVGQLRQPCVASSATTSSTIDNLDDPSLILSILAHVLMRPTWRRVVLLTSPDGDFRRLKALKRLFEHFNRTPGATDFGGRTHSRSARSVKSYECYAELLAQSGGGSIRSVAPSSAAEGTEAASQWAPPTAQSVERNRHDLATRDWYWGDVSRSEVSEVMRERPDGAFLVRDSFATTGAFTLTEKRNHNILLFRIYHRGDVFDISNPPSPGFPLVSALVAYYQQQRPFTSIDAPIPRLLYPVVRNNLLELPPNLVSVSSDQIVKSLLTALRSTSIELNQLQVDELNHRSSELMHQMAVTASQILALKRAREWLKKTNSQLSINQKTVKGVSQEALEKHANLLEQRLTWTKSARQAKRQQHKSLIDRIREVSESLVVLCSQKHQVGRRMQEIRRELKRRGISDEVIFACDSGATDSTTLTVTTGTMESADSGLQSSSTSALALPPLERSTWFAEMTRQEAEDVLFNKPSGTFLIRPSAMANRFALSIKTGLTVQHCLIYSGRTNDDSGDATSRWGFSEKSLVFSSLEDLVAFYRTTSLAKYNALLDTTLALPAFALTSTSPLEKTPTKSVPN